MELVAEGTRITDEFASFFLKKSVESKAVSCQIIGSFYGVKGKTLQNNYRYFLSDFQNWSQKSHAKEWLIFPENIGKHLSIDETSLSHGELYTILTNKSAKGRKGSIVAIISGTKSEEIIKVLEKIPLNKRRKVTEITLDMTGNMELIATKSFPKAVLVTDRFHVQQLATKHCRKLELSIVGRL